MGHFVFDSFSGRTIDRFVGQSVSQSRVFVVDTGRAISTRPSGRGSVKRFRLARYHNENHDCRLRRSRIVNGRKRPPFLRATGVVTTMLRAPTPTSIKLSLLTRHSVTLPRITAVIFACFYCPILQRGPRPPSAQKTMDLSGDFRLRTRRSARGTNLHQYREARTLAGHASDEDDKLWQQPGELTFFASFPQSFPMPLGTRKSKRRSSQRKAKIATETH